MIIVMVERWRKLIHIWIAQHNNVFIMHATNANIDNKTLIVTSKVDNLNWWKKRKWEW